MQLIYFESILQAVPSAGKVHECNAWVLAHSWKESPTNSAFTLLSYCLSDILIYNLKNEKRKERKEKTI